MTAKPKNSSCHINVDHEHPSRSVVEMTALSRMDLINMIHAFLHVSEASAKQNDDVEIMLLMQVFQESLQKRVGGGIESTTDVAEAPEEQRH